MSDAAYMDAVSRGDLSTAQRMVNEAAKAAGLKKKNLVRTLFTPREVDEIRPRAIEAVRSMAENYVFNMEYSMDEEERWSNVGFENNKLGFRTSGDDSYSIKISYVNDTDDWMKIVETHNDKKSVLDYSLRPIEYKVPSDPVTYDDNGNVIPLSQRFSSQSEDIRNPRTAPKQFPYRYAAYLKAHFPAVWAAGGNIRGNDAFRWWTQYRLGVRSPQVMYWWETTRPAWIARHYGDYRLPGVIAQIKWGVIGNLGVAGMKRVVEDAIRKKL